LAVKPPKKLPTQAFQILSGVRFSFNPLYFVSLNKGKSAVFRPFFWTCH
jgi:hypothetical protein